MQKSTNLVKSTGILEKCQPLRLVLKLVNKLHMYPEGKDTLLFKSIVKAMKEHQKQEPKMKSLLGFGFPLYISGFAHMNDDGLIEVVPYPTIRELLKKYPCTDKDLLSAEDIIWRAIMTNGPDALKFLQKGDGVLNYERKCQKPLIPGIVSDIVAQFEMRMTKKQCKEKPIIYDIGCGDGAIAIALAKKMPNATIYAYDINEMAIMKANADKPKELTNLTFSTKPLPEDNKVHMVLCINVLHDVENPAKFLQKVSKMLHNVGIAMIVDPTVSIHKEKNLYNLQVTEAVALGGLSCIHSNNCKDAMGPATGKETLLKHIESNGLHVIGDLLLAKSLFYHSFIAEKSLSLEELKYSFNIGKYLRVD